MKLDSLTPYEQMLFEALKARGGNPLTFKEMEKMTPPVKVAGDPHNKYAVHMRELRRKLKVNVINVRGVGYKLELQ